MFGLTPGQVEDLGWEDWLTYRAWADRHLKAIEDAQPTPEQQLMARHPALRRIGG